MKRDDLVNYKTLVRKRPLTDRELQLVGDKGYVLCGVVTEHRIFRSKSRWSRPLQQTHRFFHYHFTVPPGTP